MVMKVKVKVMQLSALKMEGDYESRNPGSLYKLEKARKQILTQNFQKEQNHADTLVLAQQVPFQTPDLETVRCVKLLNLSKLL